jgi:hypothetical protein
MLATRVNWQRKTSQRRDRECARTNCGRPHVQAPATKLRTATDPNADMSCAGRFARGPGDKRRGRSVHHVHSDGQRGIERRALARPLECRVVQRA